MIKHDKNITTIFIVPTLGVTSKILKENGYIRGYLKDQNCNVDYDFGQHVFLLFKPTDLKSFNFFLEEQYETNQLIIEDYNIDDNQIIVVYKLIEDLKEDYNLIFNSEYSKTSKKFQSLFPKKVIIDGFPRKSLQRLIFNKDEALLNYWENQ